MVAKKPEVASPVARIRPAEATWRRLLPNSQTLVRWSTTGT
jgi:hypothetical protein